MNRQARGSQKLLTVEQAAERLGLRVSTIRRKILERKIPYVKVFRSVRISEDTIHKILEAGLREPVSK